VALIGGAGVTVAGIAGSLMAPLLARRLSPRWLYLSIGVVGAIFTLLLIFGPRTPTSFMVAMIGENVAQSGAFTAANLVMFRAIGKDNPFAATQFALMLAAQMLPLTYMQVLDGRGYGWRGVTGAYLVDGGCGIAACAFLALLLTALARRRARGPALA